MKTGTIETCKYCGGQYISNGWCPKFGLKFRNSVCIGGEVKMHYRIVKVRNNNPWWRFWKAYFNKEKILIS